ncbi:Uncharacterised protein [Helicobacter cholecystus]|uniref:hypothetical protein n=1 Tax=Helicobacter cholecystus TaxID=45498 RepID=UPI000CF18F40|nr:hypothetical protein [Helicobacter cholecystus]VEJ24500.1 Uncharacterised protein [Helicobacter cholecystus]
MLIAKVKKRVRGEVREGNSYNARAYLGEWEGRGERENLLPLLPLAIPAYEVAIAGVGVFSAYMIHRLIKEKAQKEGISLDESAKRLGVVYGEGGDKKEKKLGPKQQARKKGKISQLLRIMADGVQKN